MKSFDFTDGELSLILEALRRMQVVSYACLLEHNLSSSEVFFKVSDLISKLSK